MVVQGIEMQGWSEGNDKRLVTMFSLEYGMDENNLTKYRENNKYEKVRRNCSYVFFFPFLLL